jgi:hypothetical protein
MAFLSNTQKGVVHKLRHGGGQGFFDKLKILSYKKNDGGERDVLNVQICVTPFMDAPKSKTIDNQ